VGKYFHADGYDALFLGHEWYDSEINKLSASDDSHRHFHKQATFLTVTE
jgi:hypothetical protein